MVFRKFFLPLLLLLGGVFLSSSTLWSEEKEMGTNKPFILTSNHLDYNEETRSVHAQGNVYVSHDRQLLYADSLTYNQLTGILYAKGNVWIRDKEGIFSFCEDAELKNQFKDGFFNQVKLLLTDNSKAIAVKGQRFHGQKVILWNGVYSPCSVCKSTPHWPPVWQLKASKIIHNLSTKEMIYHHAVMDFFGIPVFYTPYFFHSDPSVKRKTGFLTPIYGNSRSLGFMFIQPFFWNLGPEKDLTLYPVYISKGEPMIGLEYRRMFSSSYFWANTSYTANSHIQAAQTNNPDNYRIPSRNRWHFFTSIHYELSPDLLLTAQIRRASDLTYLRRYPVSIREVNPADLQRPLTSSFALEQFKQNSYGEIRGYIFQSDTPKTSPLIYPTIDYTYETPPGEWGQTYGANINFLNLTRDQAIIGQAAKKMTRGSIDLHTQVPYVSDQGDIWQWRLRLRGDQYLVDGYQPLPSSVAEKGNYSRLFPQTSLSWRYPFAQFFESSQWVLEPSSMIVMGSQGNNPITIPNEDTPYVTLDPTNLYLMNRFYGVDRVDSGKRAVYGVHSRHYFSKDRHLFFFLGQTKRLDHQTALLLSSGEDSQGSGVVGKIDIRPFPLIQLQSRFMVGRKKYDLNFAESNISLNTPYSTLTMGHIYYKEQYSTSSAPQSMVTWQFKSVKYKDIHVSYNEVRDFKSQAIPSSLLLRGVRFTHENECLTTTFSITQSNFKDRDVQPDVRFLLELTFKNLGTIAPIGLNGITGYK